MELTELTVMLSGHNIKEIAWLAIASLMYHVPELKNNIVYFDDNSTDGSREFLESKGIKVISWKNYQHYTDFKNWYTSNFSVELTGVRAFSARNAIICREMLNQCETRYCLINDGDIIYTCRDTIDRLVSKFNDGNFIYSFTENSLYYPILLPESIIRECNGYKYIHMNNYSKEIKPEFEMTRCRMIFAGFDIGGLKEIGREDLLSDSIDFKTLAMINGVVTDGGGDLYYKLINSNIQYHLDPYAHKLVQQLIHISWVSTATRKSSGDSGYKILNNITYDIKDRILEAMSRPEVLDVMEKYGMDPLDIIESFFDKMKSSEDE